MDVTRTIDLLEETWRSTIDVGHELGPDDWERATDCPGWTVKDHLSHLIGTERFLQGLPSTAADPGERAYVKNPIGESNEREVEARRATSGPEVLAEFEDLVDLRLATLRSGDDAYFAQAQLTPTGPGSMLDFLEIRILDSWIHEQDIRRAVDRPGHLGGGPAEHTIGRLLAGVPMVVGKRAGAPEGASVVVELTGPVDRTVGIVVEDGRARIAEPVPPAPTTRLAMDSETFLVLATGRQGARANQDRITIDGDQALGQTVAEKLNVMI